MIYLLNQNDVNELAEHFVLSTHLSEWNSELPLCKILEGIAEEDWEIATPWEPLEHMGGESLANTIADSIDYFKEIFKNRMKEVKQ
jgi:hypothetical protein